MVRRILVAVDGSDGARKAVRLAVELAGQLGGEVTLLHVLQPPQVSPVETLAVEQKEWVDANRDKAEEILAAAAKEAPGHRAVLLVGDPVGEVCAEAKRWNADLVITGTRGLSAMGRWVLGSVSDGIVHRSPVPVTVVR